MPYHLAIDFCDQRYCQALSSPQGRDNELLCVIADLQGLECRDGDIPDRSNIGACLVPDHNLWIHERFAAAPSADKK
jgi:hypothetical protein